MLFSCHMMAETELSRDYEKRQLELIREGHLHSCAKCRAAKYAREKERKRNADKSGG